MVDKFTFTMGYHLVKSDRELTGHYYITLKVEVRINMPNYIFIAGNESLFDIVKKVYQRPAATNHAV